jgi:hypothetical protein
VSDAAGDQLPDWLYWHSSTRTIYGVPSSTDIGHVYIQVTDTRSPNNIDVFDVHVRDETSTNTICNKHQSILFATIILNSIDISNTIQRVHLIESIAQELSINATTLRIYDSNYDTHMYERRVLMANAASNSNAVEPTTSSLLFWPIGCGTAVDDKSIDAIESLETSISSGRLTAAIGHTIIGWQVFEVFKYTSTFVLDKQCNVDNT